MNVKAKHSALGLSFCSCSGPGSGSCLNIFLLLHLFGNLVNWTSMEYGRDLTFKYYQHYKYYHFYAICFGIGCGTALYRPFCSLVLPSVLAVFFIIVFEIVGIVSDLPAHTKRCKGPPYDRRDACWGFCFALIVAVLHLNSHHVYTSYGWGIIVFALRGAKRKYSSLRQLRQRQQSWW